MVSWGEIFLTVTAAGYLLGRKELPKLAHFVGTYGGRSVGAIIRAKKEFFDATKDNDLMKLQREFQRGIDELNEIRSELTSVGSMSRPLQPSGAVEPVNQTPVAAASASGASSYVSASPQSPSVGRSTASASAGAKTAAGSSARSSISLASEYAPFNETSEERSEEASLAIAELKLARQGKYAPRIESLEGGADYVSASIMDSLLLEKRGAAGVVKKKDS